MTKSITINLEEGVVFNREKINTLSKIADDLKGTCVITFKADGNWMLDFNSDTSNPLRSGKDDKTAGI